MELNVLSFEKGICLDGKTLKGVESFELKGEGGAPCQLTLTMYVDMKKNDK